MDLLAQLALGFVMSLLLVASLGFIVGKVSVWSVGHLGFFGLGGLLAGTIIELCGGGWPQWVGATAAGVGAGLLGSVCIGFATLRLEHDSFVILSIAFGQLAWSAALALKGPDGFKNLQRPVVASGPLPDWAIVGIATAILALAGVALYRFQRRPINRVCALIRSSEPLALTLGRSPLRYKLGCFVAGSTLSALIGVVAALYGRGTDPGQLQLQENLKLFAALLLGGMHSALGFVLGALTLFVLPRLLESFVLTGPFASANAAMLTQLLLGLALVLVIRWLPEGLAGRDLPANRP